MSSLAIKNPFKNREEKFITALEQFWNELGNLPTAQKMIDLGIIESQDEYDRLIRDKFVQNALETLGIKLDPDLQILTPKQLAAAQIMFSLHDGRSDIKKLKDLGINPQTWDNWLKDPTFQEYLRTKTRNLFEEQEHEIDKALFLKARSGNVEAIKLLNAMLGRYKAAEEVAVPKIGQVDAHVFVMRLFEVLQKHLIKYPELLQAIGTEILEIQNPYMAVPKVIEAVPEKIRVNNE